MCKTDITLTQATEILKKICEMQIHFTIKCKFRIQLFQVTSFGKETKKSPEPKDTEN